MMMTRVSLAKPVHFGRALSGPKEEEVLKGFLRVGYGDNIVRRLDPQFCNVIEGLGHPREMPKVQVLRKAVEGITDWLRINLKLVGMRRHITDVPVVQWERYTSPDAAQTWLQKRQQCIKDGTCQLGKVFLATPTDLIIIVKG